MLTLGKAKNAVRLRSKLVRTFKDQEDGTRILHGSLRVAE